MLRTALVACRYFRTFSSVFSCLVTWSTSHGTAAPDRTLGSQTGYFTITRTGLRFRQQTAASRIKRTRHSNRL